MKLSLSTDEPQTVAFVIVSWNNKDLLDDCIGSIKKQDYPHKRIILVDNASSDGTVDYLPEMYPEVEVLAQAKNYGFAKGNNIGIAHALKDSSVTHIALLNTDARLAPDWTTTLIGACKDRPRAATLQSITLDYYDYGIIDSTHIYVSRLGQATQGSFRQPTPTNYDVAPLKVFGCNAAAMLITRAFIDAQPFTDFFDETMFMYLEDVDVAARATVMGWDSFVVPQTRAYHMGSASSGKNPGFSLRMTFRNSTGMLIKNLPGPILLRILLRIPKSDLASIRHLRRVGKSEGIKPLIKGRLTSLRFIPIFLYKRHKLKPYRNVDTAYLWLLMRRGF